jgi:hypothetical protein
LNSDRKDCTYENYQGYKLDRQMLDALTKSGSTGSTLLERQDSFKIYPVPANNRLLFSSIDFMGTTRFEIRDITGRILKTVNAETSANETTRLDISGMKPGMYLLSAKNNGNTVTGKFLLE